MDYHKTACLYFTAVRQREQKGCRTVRRLSRRINEGNEQGYVFFLPLCNQRKEENTRSSILLIRGSPFKLLYVLFVSKPTLFHGPKLQYVSFISIFIFYFRGRKKKGKGRKHLRIYYYIRGDGRDVLRFLSSQSTHSLLTL